MTRELRSLIASVENEAWPKSLEGILRTAYQPVFELDLEKITLSQLNERFRQAYRADGETGRKCLTFFLSAAREAGIPLSPYVFWNSRSRTSRKAQPISDDDGGAGEAGEPALPPREKTSPSGGSGQAVTAMLVKKFPSFNQDWPDPIKQQWFVAFAELMQHTKGRK